MTARYPSAELTLYAQTFFGIEAFSLETSSEDIKLWSIRNFPFKNIKQQIYEISVATYYLHYTILSFLVLNMPVYVNYNG